MMLVEHTLAVNLPVLVITIKLQNVTTCLPSVNDGWRWRGVLMERLNSKVADLWNMCWC